jgi:hypothetical protein
VPGVAPFTDIRKLAAAIQELAAVGSGNGTGKDVPSQDLVLLNMLYAPQRSRLHSLMKTLVRVENVAYILGTADCRLLYLYLYLYVRLCL